MEFGIILIGIGIVLILVRRKKQTKLVDFEATQTSTIKDITDTCQAISETLGKTGGFKQQVEVRGIVKCDKPLYSNRYKRQCVYFETKPGDGFKTERVKFHLQDPTGTILINPEDAVIEPVASNEKIIPVDSEVYILGEVTDPWGQLIIHAPSENGKTFMITLQSKEELTKAMKETIKNLKFWAIIFWLAGAGSLTLSKLAGSDYGVFHRW